MDATSFFHIDLVTILNLVSTIAIVGALIFTALQVRQGNRSQQSQAAVAVIKTVLSENLTRVLKMLDTLPENGTLAYIERSGSEMELALLEFGVRLESIGYMVFRHMVTLESIDDMMGGAALLFWTRGKGWIEREREQSGNPKFLEWCQWLAERIIERRARQEHIPAYLRQGWRE